MPNITIIRGDSYAIRRPMYTYHIVEDNGGPFDLAGCTLRTSYKTQATPIDVDPDDQLAIIRHQMTVDEAGVATSNGIYLVGPANSGVVVDRITSVESKAFDVDVVYVSDLQLTDARGEIFTWLWVDGILAIDGITNRDM